MNNQNGGAACAVPPEETESITNRESETTDSPKMAPAMPGTGRHCSSLAGQCLGVPERSSAAAFSNLHGHDPAKPWHRVGTRGKIETTITSLLVQPEIAPPRVLGCIRCQ